MNLHIDFETFSACDLPKEGLDNYAKHPTTGVHCMAFVFDYGADAREDSDEPVDIITFLPGGRHTHPRGGPHGMRFLLNHIREGGLVYAHNAAFELSIWNSVCVPRYGWPPLKAEQCRCTMAMAYAMSLPGSL